MSITSIADAITAKAKQGLKDKIEGKVNFLGCLDEDGLMIPQGIMVKVPAIDVSPPDEEGNVMIAIDTDKLYKAIKDEMYALNESSYINKSHEEFVAKVEKLNPFVS